MEHVDLRDNMKPLNGNTTTNRVRYYCLWSDIQHHQVQSEKDDLLSPVNGQLEVRDTDVVLTTIELNLCLKTEEGER